MDQSLKRQDNHGQPHRDGIVVRMVRKGVSTSFDITGCTKAGPKCSIDGPKRHVIFAQDGINIFDSQEDDPSHLWTRPDGTDAPTFFLAMLVIKTC